MKYLNKIIFINSANIAYAEISVDGNVHFTGTQGVGKSTVLRALLFFYNADKQRLGIQQGQRSFDEFYFRQSNSHILYEVMREEGAYTILVSRYQGRASWRFIDAPYQRDWLIDQAGQVASDWIKIRERIDRNITVSARIDSGTMFKDIIFGNTHDHKYTRYALVQSSHYQNIPRSIQNVFLNTKLDADFVKNTIIQSMAEEDLPIELQTYRRLVTDFEREYDEIDCWYRQAKDGSYPVRQQAQRIAEQGRTIVALDQQMLDLWHALNYAVSESEKKVPLMEADVNTNREKVAAERLREQELTTEYNKEKDSLNQQLGAKKGKLQDIAQKRKYFVSINIEEKLELADREPSLKQEVTEKRILRDDLLKAHASIEEKYNIAKGKLENARKAFELSQTEALNRKRNDVQIRRDQLDNERSKNRNQQMEVYRNWQRESDERLQLLIGEQHQADNALRELRQWHPKSEDMKLVLDDLQQLNVLEKENAAQQVAVGSQMRQLQNEYEMRVAEQKAVSDKKQEKLESERTQLLADIGRIDQLLSHLKGSLYEWLTENVDGWEGSIGKVVDEERILYAQGLEPAVDTASNSLFGVRINLENIPSSHRTPDDYRSEKQRLEERLKQVNRELGLLPVALEEETGKLSKKYTEKLNPLRQEHTRLRVEAEQIPVKRQNLQNRRHALEMEELEMVAAEQEVRQRSFNDALLKVQAEKEARKKQDEKNQKELKELDSAYDKEIKVLKTILKEFKDGQEYEAIIRNEEFAKQLQELEQQQKAELAGKGVDVKLLDQYRQAVEALEGLLRQIDSERPIVAEYHVAERDLFAIEPIVRKEIKAIEQRLQLIRQKFDDKRGRIERKRQEFEERVKTLSKELEHRKEGLALYHQAIDTEHLVPDTFLSDSRAVATHQDCQELLSRLRGALNQKHEAMEALKQSVSAFNRHFKPQNAFHFNTMPVQESDYLQIAADVQEFLDHNKIEEYRRRTSEHYKDILGRISMEVGGLMKRRSDVDGVILDINRDFVEKNFAGVIRSIELQASASSDKLMQLLMSIQSFTEENAFSIGELNLFSGDNQEEINRQVVNYLKSLTRQLQDEPQRTTLSLSDAFRLQFRVRENDNDTGWVERINNVGSDGTDILVKAMVNIMLINVFKKKAARKSGDFIVHCMMDEIGRLHPNNIKGILQFANSRNIYLINSSPTSYNPYDYKYTYMLSKHNVKTRVEKLLKRNI